MILFWGLSSACGVILGKNLEFFTQKAPFEAVLDDELTFFMNFTTPKLLNNGLLNQVTHLASLGVLL